MRPREIRGQREATVTREQATTKESMRVSDNTTQLAQTMDVETIRIGRDLILVGTPDDEETRPDSWHNCDYMGCGQSHVVGRAVLIRADGDPPEWSALYCAPLSGGRRSDAAAAVLDPDYPIERVDADLRAAGLDPQAVGQRGADLASSLLEARGMSEPTPEHVGRPWEIVGRVHALLLYPDGEPAPDGEILVRLANYQAMPMPEAFAGLPGIHLAIAFPVTDGKERNVLASSMLTPDGAQELSRCLAQASGRGDARTAADSEENSTERKARFQGIYDAVSKGALEGSPLVADDVMFLCEYVRDLVDQETPDRTAKLERLTAAYEKVKAACEAEPVYVALVVDREFVRARTFWSPAAADAYCKGTEDVHDDAQAWMWRGAQMVEVFEEAYEDDATGLLLACYTAVQELQGVGA